MILEITLRLIVIGLGLVADFAFRSRTFQLKSGNFRVISDFVPFVVWGRKLKFNDLFLFADSTGQVSRSCDGSRLRTPFHVHSDCFHSANTRWCIVSLQTSQQTLNFIECQKLLEVTTWFANVSAANTHNPSFPLSQIFNRDPNALSFLKAETYSSWGRFERRLGHLRNCRRRVKLIILSITFTEVPYFSWFYLVFNLRLVSS